MVFILPITYTAKHAISTTIRLVCKMSLFTSYNPHNRLKNDKKFQKNNEKPNLGTTTSQHAVT